MEFPKVLQADEATRAGRMLAAGDVRITVLDSETDEHVTVRFKAMFDNRERTWGGADKNWVRVPLAQATHVFIEVPPAHGDFPDKIGTYYPRTGRFFSDRNADPVRIGAAVVAACWLNEGRNGVDRVGVNEIREESYCGKCGRQLTDPVSIDRGIGPECLGQMTGSYHQVKQRGAEGRAYHEDPPQSEREVIEDILDDIRELSNAGQQRILREIQMWHSQERQSQRR